MNGDQSPTLPAAVNATQNVTAQAQNPVPVQASSSTPVSVPVGKENAPIDIQRPEEQWVQETAPEVKIEEELKAAGVEATKGDVLEVSPDVAKAGVTPSGVASPIPTEPTLKFPMTEEKAKGFLGFHKKVKESITWLAMLVVRQMQMLQLKQKKNGETKEVLA